LVGECAGPLAGFPNREFPDVHCAAVASAASWKRRRHLVLI
jgi:hypothetical protein